MGFGNKKGADELLIKDLIPNGIKEYIKLLKLKRKYIGRNIESHLIEGNVKLGLNVSISRGVEINEGVSIGECSYINRGSIIASGIIGKFCSVGYYCQIGLPEHPINYISTSPYTYGKKRIYLRCISFMMIITPRQLLKMMYGWEVNQ